MHGRLLMPCPEELAKRGLDDGEHQAHKHNRVTYAYCGSQGYNEEQQHGKWPHA